MFSFWDTRDNAAIQANMEEITEQIAKVKERINERDEKLKSLESGSVSYDHERKEMMIGNKRDETKLHTLQNELNAFQEILNDRAVPTLQQCAESAAFKSLGEIADKLCNPFCCGGRLEEQNIFLHYKSKEAGELREIRLYKHCF